MLFLPNGDVMGRLSVYDISVINYGLVWHEPLQDTFLSAVH